MASETGKKTRSSLKLSSDSVWEDSNTDRLQRRRVSFSRIICVKDNESSEEQFHLSITSDDATFVNRSVIDVHSKGRLSVEDVSDMSICSNVNETVTHEQEAETSVNVDMSVEPSVIDSSSHSIQLSPASMEVSEPAGQLSPAATVPVLTISSDKPSFKKTYSSICSPYRSIVASLPPLRHHPNVTSVHSISSKQTLPLRQVNAVSAHIPPDAKVLSQSLALTPLRQVSPKRWTHTIPWHCTKPCQLDAKSRFSNAKRLRKHLSRLSSYPVREYSPEDFACTLKSLEDFLERQSNWLSEYQNDTSPIFPDNLEQLKDTFPDLFADFTAERLRIQNLIKTQMAQSIHVAESRRIQILLSHSKSLPVVQQVKQMDTSQFTLFMAEFHERLHRSELAARQSYCEFLSEQAAEIEKEQLWELERLKEAEARLDKELTGIEQLERLNATSKAHGQMEAYLKDSIKYLENIDRECTELDEKLNDLQQENSRLVKSTSAMLPDETSLSRNDPLLVHYFGATPLVPPPCVQVENPDADVVLQECAKLFSPCALVKSVADDNTFHIQCLFGLVTFTAECDVLPSIANENRLATFPVEDHVVSSFACSLDPPGRKVLDCPAIVSFAEYATRHFSSREGRSRLATRFVGAPLVDVVQQLEYLICPYLTIGADLRAIWLAGHEVEFDSFATADLSLLTSASKAVLSSTPSHGVVQDKTQSQSSVPWDHYSHSRVFPPDPFNITVTIYDDGTRTIISLVFSFASIDPHQQAVGAKASLIFGRRVRCDVIQQILDECKIFPGSLHRIVPQVVDALKSPQTARSV